MTTWTKVLSTHSIAKASIIKGMLEENQIAVQQLNKQDSSYVIFGEIELYVPDEVKETALLLIADAEKN
jgi:hypothetical protein